LLTSLAYDLTLQDDTGLTGNYDFAFQFLDPKYSEAAPGVSDVRDFLRNLQNGLGLKATLKKMPMRFLVLDSVQEVH